MFPFLPPRLEFFVSQKVKPWMNSTNHFEDSIFVIQLEILHNRILRCWTGQVFLVQVPSDKPVF